MYSQLVPRANLTLFLNLCLNPNPNKFQLAHLGISWLLPISVADMRAVAVTLSLVILSDTLTSLFTPTISHWEWTDKKFKAIFAVLPCQLLGLNTPLHI